MIRLLILVSSLLAWHAAHAAQQVHPERGSIVNAVAKLKPGEFIWEEQIAPKGPLLLVVSVTSQRAILFRNGVPIAASTVSTGRKGYETPTGIFTVLQKHVEHYSRTYDNAPMPYMQRLTWKGVALHAGNLPGYAASHGCIRLPKGFAKLLYGTTSLGMTVVITSAPALPRLAATPEVALRGGDVTSNQLKTVWEPQLSLTGPVSIVLSAADRRAIVLRNGIEIGSAPLVVDGEVDGSWAYLLRESGSGAREWLRIDLGKGDPTEVVDGQEWQRFHVPVAFREAVASVVVPGTSVVVTGDSLKAGKTGAAATVIEDGAIRD
ncbi:MAG: L,D-transpeptidase family protein [Sphingomicrobium sp.]